MAAKKGGMATGVEVARISVKVSPDTSHFHNELKKKLEEIEKEVNGKAKVDVDDKDLDKANKKAKDTRKSVKDLNSEKIKIEYDKSSYQGALKRAQDLRKKLRPMTEWDEYGKVTKQDFQSDKLHGVLNEIKNTLDFGKTQGVHSKVLLAKWNAALNEIEAATKNRKMEVDVDLNKAKVESEALSLREKLKAYFAKKIPVKLDLDKGSSGFGRIGRIGGGGGGGRRGGGGVGVNGGGGLPIGFPSFGSGINPAGWAVIMTGLAVVAAPLVGLVSTLVLAIPGMISAIATPFMAIGLGLDGIKKAAGDAGFLSFDKKGKPDGLGPVFDNIKASVSKAFEQGLGGLNGPFSVLAKSIDPLLASLPKVATGLSDMFKGFTDSITSDKGIALFDDTIKNIANAMTAAAPGVKSFTDGMLGLANSFTQQLPGLSSWFSKTGDDFSKWIEKMTKPHDPAGSHGTAGQKSPMEDAFVGLGDTLRTIGDWAIDMAQAGLKFVSDPNKMKDFLATLDDIGAAITKLVDIGNRLAPVWGVLDKVLPNTDKLPNVNGVQLGTDAPKVKVPESAPTPQVDDQSWSAKFEAWGVHAWKTLKDGFSEWIDRGGQTQRVGGVTIPNDISTDNLKKLIDEQSTRLKGEIAGLEQAVSARSDGGFTQASSDALVKYKTQLEQAKQDLADLIALQQTSQPQVALKSYETPIGGTTTDKLLGGMTSAAAPDTAIKVPPPDTTDATAKINEYKELAVQTMSEAQKAIEGATTAQVKPPNLDAFKSAFNGLPQAVSQGVLQSIDVVNAGMQGINGVLQAEAGAANAAGASIGANICAGMAAGIANNQSLAITAAANMAAAAYKAAKDALEVKSPSRKFMELGNYTMQGMAKGMENGFQPVLDQAKDMAAKISDAFDKGDDPTGALDGFTKKEVTRMEKVLKFQEHKFSSQARRLETQAKHTTDKALKEQLQAKADDFRTQASDVSDQLDAMDLAKEYADLTNDPTAKDSFWGQNAEQIMGMPFDFGKATSSQFMQDLGMSGGGALGSLMDYGMNFGQKFIFNVSNMDDALAAQQTTVNRQNLGTNGR